MLHEAVSSIDGCTSQEELNQTLQKVIEGLGFSAYSFLDIGAPHLDEPYWSSTTGAAWESTYRSNQFIHVDSMIYRARRTNRPFSWGSVAVPQRQGRHKTGAAKVMEASADHGFQEGFVIPFHFVDDRGAVCSSLCTLFWTDPKKDFTRIIERHREELHLLFVYWVQRSLELRATAPSDANVIQLFDRTGGTVARASLSDREREVMGWAARGKTAAETAEILSLSVETVQTHIKHSVDKLGAGNKTHAVAKAVFIGLVDI